MEITNLPDWIAAVSTALAVIFAGWQLRTSSLIAQATFEDQLDQQYRELMKEIPVSLLIGERIHPDEYYEVRELIYNYFDLSNEQAFLYSRGRIGKRTWQSWLEGIRANMSKPAFTQIWFELEEVSPDTFSYLRGLL